MVATHLTVTISGGGPYGIRLTNEANHIVVDKVRKNGKADDAGLREGDVLLSVNGRSCSDRDSKSVSHWIDEAGQKLTIQILRGTSDSATIASALRKSTVTQLQDSMTLPSAHPDELEISDQSISTKTLISREVEPGQSVSSSGCNEFTVTAPSGVDVQQNADKSFTVTIGMPFQLELGQSSGTNRQQGEQKKEVEDEKFSSIHNIAVDDYEKEKDTPQQQSEAEVSQSKTRPLNSKRLERILSEGSGSEPSTPSTDTGLSKPGKKLFVDSAFYDDPEHKYPTVGEQIQMARTVAMSVISPANFKSKGHRMFIRRKQRAFRWTTGLTEEEKEQLAAQMAAAKAAEEAGMQVDDETAAVGPEVSQSPPQSAPLGLPSSVIFAPKLPKEKDVEKLNAMSNEELERMMLLERKTTHTNVSPQVCFSLVDDLKNMKGKGGKLFAKRQAKSETWGANKQAAAAEDTDETNESSAAPETDTRLAEKLQAEHQTKSTSRSGEPQGAPVNRLKEMIDVPKAAMTPWEAAAQYGTVDRAFEHLDNVPGRTRKQQTQQDLIDSLQQQQQQQQQRRREGAGGSVGLARGRGAVRPKSTIGGVGLAAEQTASNENQHRVKIEALGGNPNAAGLASALTASLAAGGGLRSARLKAASKSGDAGT